MYRFKTDVVYSIPIKANTLAIIGGGGQTNVLNKPYEISYGFRTKGLFLKILGANATTTPQISATIYQWR